MDVLRFATAGSVDDGKSSLIGRLLFDTKAVFEDQYESIELASRRRGLSEVQLSFLTDGLRAERDLKITIDVAYRYFSTPRRKFIIADTPGHFEFTRNMVTGTSTADVSVILIDASRGLFEQSRRHVAISSLLGIRHVVFAINKMDLVEYSEFRYQELVAELTQIANKLGRFDCAFIPISALHGDNVAEKSTHMNWYQGPTLLDFLETVDISRAASQAGLRLPIQATISAKEDHNTSQTYFLGQLESGILHLGDTVVAMPEGSSHQVTELLIKGINADRAVEGEPVAVALQPRASLERGDMVVSTAASPGPAIELEADLCWLGDTAFNFDQKYLLLHSTRKVEAKVTLLTGKFHLESLSLEPTTELETNEIVECKIHLDQPIFADLFTDCRGTGSFLLVDPNSRVTCAAGMIRAITR